MKGWRNPRSIPPSPCMLSVASILLAPPLISCLPFPFASSLFILIITCTDIDRIGKLLSKGKRITCDEKRGNKDCVGGCSVNIRSMR